MEDPRTIIKKRVWTVQSLTNVMLICMAISEVYAGYKKEVTISLSSKNISKSKLFFQDRATYLERQVMQDTDYSFNQ